MTGIESSAARLQAAIEDGRRRIARGEHPVYHVTWRSSEYGAVDIAIEELPIIHLFVPDLDKFHVAGPLQRADHAVAGIAGYAPDAPSV